MNNTKVAATVMLHGVDGSTKFLVQGKKENSRFVTTKILNGKTGLASILTMLKETVNINTQKIDLVDLTNMNEEDCKIPLFVFAMAADENVLPLYSGFTWENPIILRSMLKKLDITGVPIF